MQVHVLPGAIKTLPILARFTVSDKESDNQASSSFVFALYF